MAIANGRLFTSSQRLGRTAAASKAHIALQERLRWNTGSPGANRQAGEVTIFQIDAIIMLDSKEGRIEGETEEALSRIQGPESFSGNSVSGHGQEELEVVLVVRVRQK